MYTDTPLSFAPRLKYLTIISEKPGLAYPTSIRMWSLIVYDSLYESRDNDSLTLPINTQIPSDLKSIDFKWDAMLLYMETKKKE